MTELALWWLGQILRDPRIMMVMSRLRWPRLAGALLIVLAATSNLQATEATYLARSNIEQVSESEMRQMLLRHFARWEGVPYEYGGYDHRGVDCSGFVNLTYREVLGIEIPRTTWLLARIGRRVPRQRLAVGDILVFRTSRSDLHVGIYVGRGQFIHASKSRGVMRSELDSSYWSGVFVKAIRVLQGNRAA